MQGYLLAIGARHLSEHTVRDYVNTLNKFGPFMGEDITHKHIECINTNLKTSLFPWRDAQPPFDYVH